MNQFRKWQCLKIADEMYEVLLRKGYDAHKCDNFNEAKALVLAMIPKQSTVAVGGSETLKQMGLVEIFKEGDYQFFDRYQAIPFPETVEIYRQSMLADFLVTSTNALTRNGELVNTDSSGNRVAGMIFGPKRVIVVTGVNKVVENVEEALKRIRSIAPMNAKRNGHKTPCVETGKCEDCQLQASVCNSIGIINSGRKFEGRISVIIVADEAGF